MGNVLILSDTIHAQRWAADLSMLLGDVGISAEIIATENAPITFVQDLLSVKRYNATVCLMNPTNEVVNELAAIAKQTNQPLVFAYERQNSFQIGPASKYTYRGCAACWVQHRYFFIDDKPREVSDRQHIANQHAIATRTVALLQPFIKDNADDLLGQGFYIQIDPVTLTETQHIVTKHPRCPVCSSWRQQPSEVVAVYA